MRSRHAHHGLRCSVLSCGRNDGGRILDYFPYLTPEGHSSLPGLCRGTRADHAGNGRVKLLFDQNLSPKLVTPLAICSPIPAMSSPRVWTVPDDDPFGSMPGSMDSPS